MDLSNSTMEPLSTPRAGAERRSSPRIAMPFQATVRAGDILGRRFQVETVLDDLSRGGLHLRLPEQVERGASMFVLFKLSAASAGVAACVAVRGVVLRVTPHPDGRWGVAMAITNHRFL